MITECPGQLVIDFSQAYRNTDPATSQQADEKAKRFKGGHCAIILNCLRQHNGSTTKELANHLQGVLRYDQIWRRMNDLVENEYIKRNEQIQRDGNCTWWIL